MKICYLADGESIHTKRWCTYFTSLGHQVHLITFKNVKIEGVTVHYVNAGNISVEGGNWKVVLKYRAVKKLVKQIKPDVLHAQYATSYGLVGALSGFHPYIITALGTDVLISPQQSRIYRILLKYVFRHADWVTAMAEHMRETIIALGVNAQKVGTVIFGINPDVFNHNRRALPQDMFVITSTRNFEPVYNIGLLIKAFNIFQKELPNTRLNLIGGGSQRIMLEQMVRDFGLRGKVEFLGKIPQPEIAEVLNKSHVFVTTSLSDGNNISLNEAMACGAVSLATDIPANRQWIADGINGFLVPLHDEKTLADKILYVYRNYNVMQKTAIDFNDKIIAEKAIWSNNMAIVENKYQELSGKK